MPSADNPLFDSGKRNVKTHGPEEENADLISLSLQIPDEMKVRSARECGLESEIGVLSREVADLIHQQSTCPEGSALGRERRYSLSDKVSVDKVAAGCIAR